MTCEIQDEIKMSFTCQSSGINRLFSSFLLQLLSFDRNNIIPHSLGCKYVCLTEQRSLGKSFGSLFTTVTIISLTIVADCFFVHIRGTAYLLWLNEEGNESRALSDISALSTVIMVIGTIHVFRRINVCNLFDLLVVISQGKKYHPHFAHHNH